MMEKLYEILARLGFLQARGIYYIGGSDVLPPPLKGQEELDALVLKAHRNNMAAALHAIGDGAVEMCLNAIERARREMPHLKPRGRIWTHKERFLRKTALRAF